MPARPKRDLHAPLLACKHWLAFLHKGEHAFFVVGALHRLRLEVGFQVDRGFQRGGHGRAQGLLGPADGKRGALGQAARPGVRRAP